MKNVLIYMHMILLVGGCQGLIPGISWNFSHCNHIQVSFGVHLLHLAQRLRMHKVIPPIFHVSVV